MVSRTRPESQCAANDQRVAGRLQNCCTAAIIVSLQYPAAVFGVGLGLLPLAQLHSSMCSLRHPCPCSFTQLTVLAHLSKESKVPYRTGNQRLRSEEVAPEGPPGRKARRAKLTDRKKLQRGGARGQQGCAWEHVKMRRGRDGHRVDRRCRTLG